MKMYLVKKHSEKVNRDYFMLYCDLTYKLLSLTFEPSIIVELTGLTFDRVYNLPVDSPLHVGTFTREGA